ncbi:uncharacterized protein BDZ99DRAFT_91672 [Mytilinidion resinicola]|uniref:Uncharacterized protein n=1 Tax=Mytilinidion resinicola TaxID=574789 RepID=A0A6A6YDW1_9PEZI|nr:uncharacterized protein BDZ99DRAFT_91672 [Mytilinidion resinicola]KAF2806184.1 hypothetical protein BDZ99DRAFT_91672 [Mytilinidion resinicola]
MLVICPSMDEISRSMAAGSGMPWKQYSSAALYQGLTSSPGAPGVLGHRAGRAYQTSSACRCRDPGSPRTMDCKRTWFRMIFMQRQTGTLPGISGGRRGDASWCAAARRVHDAAADKNMKFYIAGRPDYHDMAPVSTVRAFPNTFSRHLCRSRCFEEAVLVLLALYPENRASRSGIPGRADSRASWKGCRTPAARDEKRSVGSGMFLEQASPTVLVLGVSFCSRGE